MALDLFQNTMVRIKELHTSIDFALLHVFARHGVRFDNVRQRALLKVLFAGLFLRVVLACVLFHTFQMIRPSAEFVLAFLEEFACLLAHFNHPVLGVSEHLNNP